MNLETLYTEVYERIASLDFKRIWPGFRPLKFALYNDDACFFDGRFMLNALRGAERYPFDAVSRPVLFSVLRDYAPSTGDFPAKSEQIRKVTAAVQAFRRETEGIIRSAVEANQVVLKGPFKLTGVNVYNARSWKDYLTSTYFLMYREGREDKLLQGNFVIKMLDGETIDCVYRWQ